MTKHIVSSINNNEAKVGDIVVVLGVFYKCISVETKPVYVFNENKMTWTSLPTALFVPAN
jgi:hypothetical protein